MGVGLLLMLLMFIGCKQNNVDQDLKKGDADSLTIHIAVLPTEECVPFYTAQQRGFYDALGVVVKLDTFYAAMDADTAFMRGHVQLLVSDSLKAHYLNTLIHKDTILSVLTDTLRLHMMTGKSTRIKSIKNLKEKIVAVTRNSADDYFADKTMDQARIKREYLNRPQINNIELRAKMLGLNQYDGAILPEPYATKCEAQGAYRINSIYEPLMRVLVKKKFKKSRENDIKKIVEAYYKAKAVEGSANQASE